MHRTEEPLLENRSRKHSRHECAQCRCRILQVNGAEPAASQAYDGGIRDIGKGGFCFVTTIGYELEDRLLARLQFADGSSHETLGRICYCNEEADGMFAYGFSILKGFYSLKIPSGLG